MRVTRSAANAKDPLRRRCEAAGMTAMVDVVPPPKKLKTVCEGIRAIAAQLDGQRPRLAPRRDRRREGGLDGAVDLGADRRLLVIFESRPDVRSQKAGWPTGTANGFASRGTTAGAPWGTPPASTVE